MGDSYRQSTARIEGWSGARLTPATPPWAGSWPPSRRGAVAADLVRFSCLPPRRRVRCASALPGWRAARAV